MPTRYGNTILLTDELPNGQMVDEWEAITEKTVKTSLEVYTCDIFRDVFLNV